MTKAICKTCPDGTKRWFLNEEELTEAEFLSAV